MCTIVQVLMSAFKFSKFDVISIFESQYISLVLAFYNPKLIMRGKENIV